MVIKTCPIQQSLFYKKLLTLGRFFVIIKCLQARQFSTLCLKPVSNPYLLEIIVLGWVFITVEYSIKFSDMVWKVFASLMNLANERKNKLISFADPILINKNCNWKLPLNKMIYVHDLHFDKIYDINYRGKKFVIDGYICSSKTMLPV